jgi:hypothetical protein
MSRDFSGYFTLGPGSGEIGKNRDNTMKLGIFKFDWLVNANVHWLKIGYVPGNTWIIQIHGQTKYKMHAGKLLFQFYNTVTVTIKVYIQTHCHDHHIQSWFPRREWYNMHGNHATFVLDGIGRPPSHPHSVYWNLNARCWLFTKNFLFKNGFYHLPGWRVPFFQYLLLCVWHVFGMPTGNANLTIKT